MLPKTSTQAACMFLEFLPWPAIESIISADGFVVSIDMTNFGLLGGTIKVALIMSSNLLLDVVSASLSCCNA